MITKKLIVNADDFGQSVGINKGIIRAYEQGIVTSTSLMVRYPAAIEATAYAKTNNALGIGLHIDLGEWFYNNGNWDPVYQVITLDDITAVKEEIKTQLEIFYHIMGRQPTHIDSHQHIHQRLSIRPLFIEIAQELNITLRGCSNQVKYCGDFYGQCEDGSPYHSAISVNGLNQIISGLTSDITELACHPGINNNIETMYRLERTIELGTLCDPAIRQALAEAGIELCSFNGIGF